MLVAGLDGGGTKTEGVVLDEAGTVVARARSGGVNLNFVSVEECQRSVAEVLSQLAEQADGTQVVRLYSVMLPDITSIRHLVKLAFPMPSGGGRPNIGQCWRRGVCWSRMASVW